MTTSTWITAIAHSTDAEFRTWGLELSTKLQAMNLVKTSDTGQINWATVTRPGNNTPGGYEIYRFNDSLQGTNPIFFKLEYGTGASGAYPQMWFTVGTGSNGSGTLTGSVTARDTICYSAALLTGNYASYLCVADGFFGLYWKSNGMTGAFGIAFAAISRTYNTSGVVTGDGYRVTWGSTGSSVATNTQSVRTAATAVVYAVSNSFCFVPGMVVGSLIDSDIQIYPHFGISPTPWILPNQATAILSEVPQGTTVSVAMVGSTARTLLSISSGFRSVVIGTGPGTGTTYGHLMLWE